MSAVRTIVNESGSWLVVDDLELRFAALIAGEVVDELSGAVIQQAVSIEASLVGVAGPDPGRFVLTSSPDGSWAIAGSAARAFPDLVTVGHQVAISIGTAGYLTTNIVVAVPAGTTDFPLEPPPVAMRRDAVELAGRVVRRTPGNPPVVGQQVQVIDPSGLIGFTRALSDDHPAGATAAPATITPSGPPLPLAETAYYGDAQLSLLARTGLAQGAVVILERDGIREYAIVESLQGPASLDRAGVAVLRAPLGDTYTAAGPAASLGAVTPIPPGATVTRDAFAQDRVAFVDQPEALGVGDACLIGSGTPDAEYRIVHLPDATTDANGYFGLAPIGRATSVTVALPLSGLAPITAVLDLAQAQNQLKIRI
jgi:hypothetical protein